MSHLRAGIAIDHSGSFLVIGTLVVTQPLYRAQVQVWAAGMNLTFWNWSGQRRWTAASPQQAAIVPCTNVISRVIREATCEITLEEDALFSVSGS